MSNKPHVNDFSHTQSYRMERPVRRPGQRHGRPSSWALVAVVILAFIVGGFAVVFRLWPLFWVCVGIFVLCIPVGKVLGIMNDTVGVEEPFDEETKPAADRGTSAHPGVRVKK
jgi:fatty acid desaturase